VVKTYGQFCALARALDHVGDRWTLLVIRELLLGDASYGDLQAALRGIPTNLLAERLRDLEADGLVIRRTSEVDRRRVVYRMTALGRGLEPALRELIVWGAHWMRTGPSGDRFDPRWAALALSALLHGRTPSARGIVVFRLDGGPLTVASTGSGRVKVEPGRPAGEPDAEVEGDAGLLLAVASGQLPLESARRRGLRVRGDRRLVHALLQP
jgi:DNA-binding HxlR family transcriptional regulator